MTTTATEKHAKTDAPKKAWEFTEDFDIVDTVPKAPAKRVRRAPTRGRSVAPPSPLRNGPFGGAPMDSPAARHWAALAADPWHCEPWQLEEALQTITEVAASLAVTTSRGENLFDLPYEEQLRVLDGARTLRRSVRVPITVPEYLDFAHVTIKTTSERVGAMITVSVPRAVTERLSGKREFAFASKYAGEERPFEELMLWHRDKITEAVRAAKPVVSARAAAQS